jgi:hypothetical protein
VTDGKGWQKKKEVAEKRFYNLAVGWLRGIQSTIGRLSI